MERSDNGDERFKFTGKEQDAETDFNYFGARYYDAGVSVWLSVDPISSSFPSCSPYCYVYQNPISYIDEKGLWGRRSKAEKMQRRAEKRYGEKRVGKVFYDFKKDEYFFKIYDSEGDKNKDGQWTGRYIQGIEIYDVGTKIYSKKDRRVYDNQNRILERANWYPSDISRDMRMGFAKKEASYYSHQELWNSLLNQAEKKSGIIGGITSTGLSIGSAATSGTISAVFGSAGIIIGVGTTMYTIEYNRINSELTAVLKAYWGTDPKKPAHSSGVFVTHTFGSTTYGGGVQYDKYYDAETGNHLGTVKFWF